MTRREARVRAMVSSEGTCHLASRPMTRPPRPCCQAQGPCTVCTGGGPRRRRGRRRPPPGGRARGARVTGVRGSRAGATDPPRAELGHLHCCPKKAAPSFTFSVS